MNTMNHSSLVAHLPSTPCVYVIKNTSSDRVYVGSTLNARSRCNGHFNSLQKGNHKNKLLQNDFNELGIGCFSVDVLREIKDSEIPIVEHENEFIKEMQPYYNYRNTNKCKSRNRPSTNIKRENRKAALQQLNLLSKRLPRRAGKLIRQLLLSKGINYSRQRIQHVLRGKHYNENVMWAVIEYFEIQKGVAA